MLTDAQVRLMRLRRMEGKTQQAAAAAAGMSERSARTWEEGPLPCETKKPRTWRTRVDPFVEVWERDLVPLLERDEKGVLQATTLLDVLQERYAGRFADGQVRTLQRRLRDWRAISGPEKEVFFEQVHVPGHCGASTSSIWSSWTTSATCSRPRTRSRSSSPSLPSGTSAGPSSSPPTSCSASGTGSSRTP